MRIQIREHDLELTLAQRTYAERQLGLALGRFGDRIGRVVLRVSPVGRVSPGTSRCQIDVGLQPRTVRVEETDADLLLALERVADRASRSVVRALEREHELRDRPLPSRARKTARRPGSAN